MQRKWGLNDLDDGVRVSSRFVAKGCVSQGSIGILPECPFRVDGRQEFVSGCMQLNGPAKSNLGLSRQQS